MSYPPRKRGKPINSITRELNDEERYTREVCDQTVNSSAVPVSIICSTTDELWKKLFTASYTDHWRLLIAEELCERFKLDGPHV